MSSHVPEISALLDHMPCLIFLMSPTWSLDTRFASSEHCSAPRPCRWHALAPASVHFICGPSRPAPVATGHPVAMVVTREGDCRGSLLLAWSWDPVWNGDISIPGPTLGRSPVRRLPTNLHIRLFFGGRHVLPRERVYKDDGARLTNAPHIAHPPR
jgi:hypothetical protein